MNRFVSILLLSGLVMGSWGTLPLHADEGSSEHHGGRLKKACGNDIAKFCSGKEGREAVQCLKGQSSNTLSQTCQDMLKKIANRKHRDNNAGAPPQSGVTSGAQGQ
jgi:hypothetical protein